jgi:hypothetical protein
MYGFTLRGPANKLAEAAVSPSPSSSFCGMRVSTSGRVSNLIGAIFSLTGLSWGSGLGRGGLMAVGLTGSGFAATGFGMTLGAGLLGFTVTFDVAGDGLGLAGGRTTFFLGAAGL